MPDLTALTAAELVSAYQDRNNRGRAVWLDVAEYVKEMARRQGAVVNADTDRKIKISVINKFIQESIN